MMVASILVVGTVLSAFGAYVLAPRKGRAAKWWVVACLFLGALPLIVLALLPKRADEAAA